MRVKRTMKKFLWNNKLIALLLSALLCLNLSGCSVESEDIYDAAVLVGDIIEVIESDTEADTQAVIEISPTEDSKQETTSQNTDTESEVEADLYGDLPIEGEFYYDVENVVLYLYLYDELPENYITKSEARDLGWEGGSVEEYLEGAAIGGDRFGNREGNLPEDDDRYYTECDIDTNGQTKRGAKRLVFSNDGLYFYTEDHYETFDELIITEEFEVVFED